MLHLVNFGRFCRHFGYLLLFAHILSDRVEIWFPDAEFNKEQEYALGFTLRLIVFDFYTKTYQKVHKFKNFLGKLSKM